MLARVAAVVLAAAFVLSGCMTVGPENPAFAIDRAEAKADLERMKAEPAELDRPVVVLNGWRSPHVLGAALKASVRDRTSGDDADFATISYTLSGSIPGAAAQAVRSVEGRWPSDDPERTVEVDVVAISMGGLVARLAAMPADDRKRLNIRRLYTLNTPHQGARLASWIAIDPASFAMKPGSAFLADLDAADRGYELIAYTQLNDTWVGATRAAPTGEQPIWARGTAVLSHFTIRSNPQILSDLSRRLRGEPPIAEPSEPPSD